MQILRNISAVLFFLLAVVCIFKGLLSEWKYANNLIPTKRSRLLKAIYFSTALLFFSVAFEIKNPTMLCVYLFPLLLVIIWLEFVITMSSR